MCGFHPRIRLLGWSGARTATEMRAFLVSMMRRRMGLAAVQAMARHRIARVPYIGVPRAIVQTRMQRGTVAGQAYAPAPGHADFYQFQVNPGSRLERRPECLT